MHVVLIFLVGPALNLQERLRAHTILSVECRKASPTVVNPGCIDLPVKWGVF